MNSGTQNANCHMYQVIKYLSDCVEVLQFVLAGLSLPVPAHPVRSCSTRSRARLWHPASLYLLHPCSRMNLARSDALHAAQKLTFPVIHE